MTRDSLTMTNAGKAKDKRSKTKKSRVKKPRLDDGKALEAELERKYIIERFYDTSDIFSNCSLFFMGLNLFCTFVLPGGRYACSVATVYWLIYFVANKIITLKYRDTEHGMYGRKLYSKIITLATLVHEFIQVRDDSLASEEGRKAHIAFITLGIYFLATLLMRLGNPRPKGNAVWCVIFPLIVWKYPRLGIFTSRYEAFAFFLMLALGNIVGSMVDELRWRHFLYVHKMKQELSKSNRRATALESLACGQESYFFEIIRR